MKEKSNGTDRQISYLCSDMYFAEIFEPIWYDLGKISSNYGFSELAIFCFENAMCHKLKDPRSLYGIGTEFVFMNNYERVVEVVESLSGMCGSSFYINVLLGHVFLSNNDVVKSFSHFSEAALTNRDDMLLLYGIAKWNELLERRREALKYFLMIIRRYSPHNLISDVQFRLACLCKSEGAYGYARRILTVLENKRSNNVVRKDDVEIQLASCYEIQDNNDDAAINICKSLVNRRPDYIFAYRLLGWIFLKSGRWEDVMGVCEDGLKLNSSDPYLVYLLGRALNSINEPERALKVLTRGMACGGEHMAYYWNTMGIANHLIEAHREALKCFNEAIRCDEAAVEPRINSAIELSLLHDDQNVDVRSEIEEVIGSCSSNDDELVSRIRTYNMETIAKTKPVDMDTNVAFTPYFSPHLFIDSDSPFLSKHVDVGTLDPF